MWVVYKKLSFSPGKVNERNTLSTEFTHTSSVNMFKTHNKQYVNDVVTDNENTGYCICKPYNHIALGNSEHLLIIIMYYVLPFL